jgi:hypothetical protein
MLVRNNVIGLGYTTCANLFAHIYTFLMGKNIEN